MEAERNYARFYALLNRLPGADKETLVEQYTHGRTTRLHQTTLEEYNSMCDDMARVVGCDERMAELRRRRSGCLKLMQMMGVDTTDWPTVDNFCLNPRIAGKPFARLSPDELGALQAKLRAIMRKGGLRKATAKQQPIERKDDAAVIVFHINNLAES